MACHVVAMPYPGRGNLNPMMNFCKILVSRKNDILVTFVVTEEWLGFIGSDPKPDNIRFASIPNVVPSELVRAADMNASVEAAMTKMEVPFEKLLDQLETPPTVIVADTALFWAVSVGKRRNISVASFWTMSASVFTILQHSDLFAKNGHFPVDISVRGGERVDYIPGISSTRLVDVPSPFIEGSQEQQQMLHRILKYKPWVPKAQCVLFTSIYELESHTFDALRAEFTFPISTIGPVIPYLELGSEDSSLGIDRGNLNYIEWLDCQPKSSVLYISMGSFLSVSSAQIAEIAAGLGDSGIKFLWVARGETCRLKEICGDIGLIVPWCHQLRVLSHSSIAGFLTHCGWNSVQEGVFCGVPFLTFPIAIDQPQNSRLIVEDWKTGWRVKQDVGEDKLVTREEIAGLVQKFMDLENDEVKEMRRRATELQQICQRAINKSGSSETNIDAFIRSIAQCHAC